MEHHEAYLTLARQGRICLLSPVIFPTRHSMDLKNLWKKTQKNTQKTPAKLGHLPVPLPLPSFSYPSSLLKWTETIFFFVVVVTAASFIRPFVKRHQNSHLFWWRPSPSPPAEKLLAVQRGRTESRDKVLVRGGGGRNSMEGGQLGSWSRMLDFIRTAVEMSPCS